MRKHCAGITLVILLSFASVAFGALCGNNCKTCGLNSVCLKCTNNFFLLDGACVSSCGETGVNHGFNKIGRVCESTAFQCNKGRTVGLTVEGNCECLDSVKCDICEFGVNNHHACLQCKFDKYNLNGVCVDSCPATMASVGLSFRGRSCETAPYTCTDDQDTQGNACKCVSSNCHSCEWGEADTHKCTVCAKDTYLWQENCVKTCPLHTNPRGQKNIGRTCKTFAFRCRDSFIVGMNPSRGCACPNANCMDCKYDDLGNSVCLRCANGMYLNPSDSTCVASCPPGLEQVGTAQKGRVCATTTTTTIPTTLNPNIPTRPTPAPVITSCDDQALDAFSKELCTQCPFAVNIMHKVNARNVAAIVSTQLGQTVVAGMISRYPGEIFYSKPTEFSVVKRTDADNGDERVCLFFFPTGLTNKEMWDAASRLHGINFLANIKLPPALGEVANTLLGLLTSDNLMKTLAFKQDAVIRRNAAATTAAPTAATTLAPTTTTTQSFTDIANGALNTDFAEMSLMHFKTKPIKLFSAPATPMGVRLHFLGITLLPGNVLKISTIVDGIGQLAGSQDVSQYVNNLANGIPAIDAVLTEFMDSGIDKISIMVDNGNRVYSSLRTLLRVLPMVNKGNDIFTMLAGFYGFKKNTVNMRFDTIIGSGPKHLGKIGTTDVYLDEVNLALEVTNVFNSKAPNRDYCLQDHTGGYYMFAPPEPRAFGFEIGATWRFGSSFRIKVALRRAPVINVRQQPCKNPTSFEAQMIARGYIERSKLEPPPLPATPGPSVWQMVAFLPPVSVKQFVCLGLGVDAGIGDNTPPQGCSDAVFDALAFIPREIKFLTDLLDVGIGMPVPFSGLNPPNFDLTVKGPQLKVYMDGSPKNWAYAISGSITILGFPTVPLEIRTSSKNVGKNTKGSTTRRAGGATPAVVFGYEFGFDQLEALLIQAMNGNDLAVKIIKLIGMRVDGSIGFFVSSAELNVVAFPEMAPDMDLAHAMKIIPAGITVAMFVGLPKGDCPDLVCSFIRKYLGDPKISLHATLTPLPLGVTVGAALSDVIMVRDSCRGPAGSLYEIGRPTVMLTKFGIFTTASLAEVAQGFDALVTFDVGNYRKQNDPGFCDYMPSNTVAYKWMEPLTFRVQMLLSPTGLYMSGAMIGVWTKAFGIDVLHVSDLHLGMGITVALGLPAVEVGGGVQFGRDCYIPDEVFGGLKLNPASNCIGAHIDLGFDPANPTETYFGVQMYGLTLENMIDNFLPDALRTPISNALPQVVKDSGFLKKTNAQGELLPNPTFSYSLSLFGHTTPTGYYYPPGIAFSGKLNVLGVEIWGEVIIDPTQRIKLLASMDPLDIGGVLKFQRSSTNANEGPVFSVDVKYGLLSPIPNVNVTISGFVKLLGISAEALLTIDNSGLHLFLEAKLFTFFQARLWVDAAYGSIQQASFGVRAELQADFSTNLANKVTQYIQQAAQAANAAFEAAQGKIQDAKASVAAAQAEILSANGALESAKSEVRRLTAKKEAAQAVLTNAQNKVDAEKQKFDAASDAVAAQQTKVNSASAAVTRAQNDVNSKKQAVTNEENRVSNQQAVVNAQKAKVTAEQNKVNTQQATVNAEKKKLDDAKKPVEDAKKKVDDAKKEVDKLCTLATCKQVCVKDEWKICCCSFVGADYPCLQCVQHGDEAFCALGNAGCKALRDTAYGVLDAAKGTLTAAQGTLDAAKIAFDAANLVLEGYKQSLNAAKGVLDGANLVLEGYKRSLVVAKGALDAANTFLDGVKGTLTAANFVLAGLAQAVKDAQVVLDVAKGALSLASQGLNAADLLVIAANGVLSGAQGAVTLAANSLNAANFVLDGANAFLGVLNNAVQGALGAFSWLASNALDQLIIVHMASFDVQLSVADGGSFGVLMDITLVGNRFQESFNVNFQFGDVIETAKTLAERAFAGITNAIPIPAP